MSFKLGPKHGNCPKCGAAMEWREYGRWWYCATCNALRRKCVAPW